MKAADTSTQLSNDAPAAVPDQRFESLVRLARQHFNITAAIITLVDTDDVRVKSCAGIPETSAPLSLCSRPTASEAVLVIPDLLVEPRPGIHSLAKNPPHALRFYAGHPLVDVLGNRVGTFCLIDHAPRDLNDEQREFFGDLARLATALIEGDITEEMLRREELVLRESERRMALALAGSGTGIWDRDVPANEIHYSEGWKAMLGYAEDEVGNQIFESYTRVHPDDLLYVRNRIKDHFEQRSPIYEVEHRLRCKDGTYKWVSSRGKVVSRDSEGNPLRMIGTTTDITEMRTIADELRKTAELITDLTNEVPGLVFQYQLKPDKTAFFSYASAGIRDIYRVSPEEVASDAALLDRIIHPDDLFAYHASLEASADSLTPWHLEYRVQFPTGVCWRQGDARPHRLADGTTLWHGFITDITERKRIETELQEFATTDYLTQLPNRRHFMAQIETELAHIQGDEGKTAAILMCDLDHFKSINDKWGHAVGDQALLHFSSLLRAQLRKTDVAGRIGGEEFAIMLRSANAADAERFAMRLQQAIADCPLVAGGQRIALGVSVGITIMNQNDTAPHLPLSRSDKALYRAKVGGRNRIEYHA